jgi:YD repeat-containing protein
MRRAHRFPQRLVRWTSLCVCLALVLTSLALVPFSVVVGNGGVRYETARRSERVDPAQGQSNGNGKARKVNATPPQPGPPTATLPNLDDVRRSADEARRNGGRQVHAPQPIPSTRHRRRGGRASSKLTPAQTSNLLLADTSPPFRRRELKADVWSSLSPRASGDPISDSPIGLFSSLRTNVAPAPQGYYNPPMARIDPHNRTGTGGADLLSNNFNWNLPLLGLGGRGLDLGLTLSYNSLVWARSGNYIDFDVDAGSMAPGFRLGFPTVEGPYWNDQAATYFYLMVMPSGARVELRRIGSSSTYESADSAHLQLIDYGTSLLVRPTDGTQLNFVTVNYTWRCNQIKDRNGNYLSVSYNSWGDIATITDTLGRVVNFNYDGYDNLTSITQTWNGQTHQWATFGYGSVYIGYNFSGLTSYGPDGSYITVLTQVGLADGSRYNFEYNNTYGQVSAIHYYAADNHQRRYTTYAYSASGSDCPRVSQRRDWAENWNGDYDDVPAANEEAVTEFTHDQDGACRMTAPDGTAYKEYYGTGWQSGLTTQSEIWSGGVRQKWTTTARTRDNTGVNYQTNPRITETNVYDVAGNRRRTTVDYTSFGLPAEVKEYAADSATVLRRTTTTYFWDSVYIDKRIVGLPREIQVYDQNNQPVSKTWFDYDWGGDFWAPLPAAATQHDASGDYTGRGLLCWIGRWDTLDVNNFDKTQRFQFRYNRTGSLIRQSDPLWHEVNLSYTDSFSDGNNSRNTFAYPTTVTDADGFSSSVQYNFDFGAKTRAQGPPPAGQSQGAIQTMTYDGAGRISRVDNQNNGAYTRWDYAPYSYVSRFDTIQDGAGEQYTTTVWDGGGRVRAVGGSNPGSSGGYWGKFTIYDVMGRPNQQTNPAEINGGWAPVGDDAAGWISSFQSYDWKGRPTITTNQDGTQKYASYSACGCAGSDVTTLTDEVGRQQKVYSEVLGRTAKTEVLNWDSSVYSTTSNTYNARDQVTLVRQYQGSDNSSVYQDTTMSYDGYGRLASRHDPEQVSWGSTTFTYNADDTVLSSTDARGASTSYGYNGRRLVTGINYSAPYGILVPAGVTFSYDAAGNRTSMIDGLGSVAYQYDQSSRLLSESRRLNDLPNAPVPNNAYTISYSYNLAGGLMSLTDPFGEQVSYTRDAIGRLSSLSRPGANGIPDTMSGIQYRAWGKPKQATLGWSGNTTNVSYNYDARMEVSRFQIANAQFGTQGAQYQRYADAQVSYAQDLSDPQFDRAYFYDQQMGRVTAGLSGAEARGSGPADGPYRQTYGYDAFSNLTTRSGRLWTHNTGSQASTFVNNRNIQSQYDLDGRPTQNGAQTFRYDAAGRQITPTGSAFEMYDGDGRRLRRDNTLYELRSTVLDGQVVVNILSQGQRSTTITYADGNPVGTGGWQDNSPITWQLHSAINSDVLAVSYGFIVDRQSEFSPIGDNVGTENPYLNGGDGSMGYPSGGGDASSMKCAVDGMEADCSSVGKFFLKRTWAFVVNRVIEQRFSSMVSQTNAQLVSGGSHGGQTILGEANTSDDTKVSRVEVIAEPDRFDVSTVGAIEQTLTLLTPVATFILPQNTPQGRRHMTEEEYLKLRKDLNNLLQGDCKRLVEATLTNIAKAYGGVFSTDLLDMLDYVHDAGELYRDDSLTIGGYGGGNVFDGQPPDNNGRPIYSNVTLNGSWGLQVAVEELTHADGGPGRRSIPHEVMAQAALDAAGPLGVRFDGSRGTTYSQHPEVQPPNTFLGDNMNSQTFRGVLMQRCAF